MAYVPPPAVLRMMAFVRALDASQEVGHADTVTDKGVIHALLWVASMDEWAASDDANDDDQMALAVIATMFVQVARERELLPSREVLAEMTDS